MKYAGTLSGHDTSVTAKLLRKIVLMLATAAIGTCVSADGIIEGSMTLGERKAKRRHPARYQRPAEVKPGKRPPPQAVIYLESESATRAVNVPQEPLVLHQRNYQFLPAILPIQVGSRIAFPNEDPEYHNVFSYSAAKAFDLGRYRKEEAPPVITFDKPGEIKLFCEIHSHMRGTILVLETPYFTMSTNNGNYRIKDVPAGTYTLRAWAQSKIIHEAEIDVPDNGVLRVDVMER